MKIIIVSQHMGQILRNDAIFSKHFKALRSGMELALQPTEKEDCLGETDLLLSCRQVFFFFFDCQIFTLFLYLFFFFFISFFINSPHCQFIHSGSPKNGKSIKKQKKWWSKIQTQFHLSKSFSRRCFLFLFLFLPLQRPQENLSLHFRFVLTGKDILCSF